MVRRTLGALTAAGLAVALAGCDPAGPGAAGTVSASATIDAPTWTTLVIGVFADPTGTFDPSKPLPADALTSIEELRSAPLPHRYEVGGGVGTTPTRDWRMVAWLTKRPGGPFTSVERGDAFCTTRFTIAGCGAFGGYCGTTHGVDCTIDRIAP